MKTGDIITIYEDPITEKKPEGKALLLRKMGEDPFTIRPRLSYWWVEFLHDGLQTQRLIKIR